MIKDLLYRIRFAFQKDEPYSRLSRILGFVPRNKDLYALAMRHRSSNSNHKERLHNNERLEFLGDTVLSTIISDIIYHQYPEQREGDLTNLRSKIVQRATLDQLAIDIGLKPFIQSSNPADMVTDNHITGNAFEALIGAIFIDRGYNGCKKFILSLIKDKYIDLEAILKSEVNFKSKFIEWTQRRKVSYRFTHHADEVNAGTIRHYTATVYVEDIEVGHGNGRNKKEAEQYACKMALSAIKKKAFKQQLTLIKPDVSLQIEKQKQQEEEAGNP